MSTRDFRPENHHNPASYYCAPNAATPEYVSAWDLEAFLAYGFFLSAYWLEDISGYPVTPDDVRAFRSHFLDVMGSALPGWPELGPEEGLDLAGTYDGIELYPEGMSMEDSEDYLMFTWYAARRHNAEAGDDALLLELHGVDLGPHNFTLDDTAIWLDAHAVARLVDGDAVFDDDYTLDYARWPEFMAAAHELLKAFAVLNEQAYQNAVNVA
jgi:hypothetical protein